MSLFFSSHSLIFSSMGLTPKSALTLFLFLFLLLPISSSTVSSSIENLLKSQGLPGGLFPTNVKSYEFDQQTGRLEVHLESPCIAEFDSRVWFDRVVRANLTYGGLVGLEGLIQEELFLWFPVKGIIVNDPSSGLILIDIGLAHKQLSYSLFEDPPVCQRQGLSAGVLMEKFGRKMGTLSAEMKGYPSIFERNILCFLNFFSVWKELSEVDFD